MSSKIIVKEHVAHIHTENGLIELFIKYLQLIAKPLLVRTKLLVLAYGHAILHVEALVCIKLISYHKFFILHMAFSQQPNIYHFKIFESVIYVLISPPQLVLFCESFHFH